MNKENSSNRQPQYYAKCRTPDAYFMYKPNGGDESSQDDESTLKCGAAWSGSESVHSSTSELSSSSGDPAPVTHAVDQDFQWVRTSPTNNSRANPPVSMDLTASTAKPMRIASPKTFAKPPKTASKPKQNRNKDASENGRDVESGNTYDYSRTQPSDARKTPVSYDKATDCNSYHQYGVASSIGDRRSGSYHQEMTEPFQPQDVEYSEPHQNSNHFDSSPKTGSNGNISKLPPAFDKTGSLDRRKKTSNRTSRDQKCRSSILSQCHSPRFRSPSRHYQPEYYEPVLHNRYDSNSSLCHDHHYCPGYRQPEVECCGKGYEEQRCDPAQRYGSSGMLHARCHCANGSTHELNHCCAHSPAPWQCSGSRWRLKGNGGDVEERVKRLEGDKKQLQLQVAVLMDQVEAQADKISDQEKLIDERKRQLAGTEDLLQREVLGRSSLETHKLELLSVVCELKLQLAALDRDNQELRRLLPLAPGSPRRMPHPQDIKTTYQRSTDYCASLPRQQTPGVGVRKGVAFGKGISPYNPAGDRSYSTPNLAETESVVIVDRVDGHEDYDEDDSAASHKAKGIKKMFGRMKRSGSGNLEDISVVEGEFRRGGVRATAGPRLGWTSTPQTTPAKMELPRLSFVEWDGVTICAWLQDMGLECYVNDAKRWVKSGAQLLAASAHEIDKELGIKNPLHRKKLQLALLSHQDNVTAVDPDLRLASSLDTAWVLRWLDDTGLPQHKEAFLSARVDGRVLHRLTMDDLATLHVTSHLHVASLRRGIQVLRSQGFEADCLERRSIPGEPARVLLWTNHRVMEWLRVVDLAEYAPNLRGSGVHGGLLFFEPRFTADLLASLLAIPPGKTLLRRHLNTHFKELLGKDCIQDKREAEATLGYIPLTPTTKLKVVKKSQFTLKRKKSRSELEFGDLVCPLDSSKTDDAEPSPKGRGCLSGN